MKSDTARRGARTKPGEINKSIICDVAQGHESPRSQAASPSGNRQSPSSTSGFLLFFVVFFFLKKLYSSLLFFFYTKSWSNE